MVEDLIKKLLIAFDDVPYKGLFLWQSLLLPTEVDYEALLTKSFASLNQVQKNSKIEEIKICLKQMRAEALGKTEVKAKVVTIRDTIISMLAHGLIMDKIKKELKK